MIITDTAANPHPSLKQIYYVSYEDNYPMHPTLLQVYLTPPLTPPYFNVCAQYGLYMRVRVSVWVFCMIYSYMY